MTARASSRDKQNSILRFRMVELPVPVEIVNERGEAVLYMLQPAGRRLIGACLQKADEIVAALLRRR